MCHFKPKRLEMLKSYAFPNIHSASLVRLIQCNLLVNLIILVNPKVLLLVNFLFDWGKEKKKVQL